MDDWYGGAVSIDLKEDVIPEKKWYQCKECFGNLRTGKHRFFCNLSPVDQQNEVERVKCIITTMSKAGGLKCLKT
jgi:hypothetical protein